MPSYYDGKPFLNTKYLSDITFENYINTILFPDEVDLSRIIYSSNEYAFRKRGTNKDSVLDINNLDLPFLNYKIKSYDFFNSSPTWFNNAGFAEGIYVPELQKKIKLDPVQFSYECSFWCNRDDEMIYAMNVLRFVQDNQTLLNGLITIDTEDLKLPIHFKLSGLALDPVYNEKDWLERNKIHSLALDFDIFTWNIVVNAGSDTTWRIAETVIFDFIAQHGIDDTTTYTETLELVVDHLSETVS